MLKEIEQFKKYVEIAGFKNVRIDDLDRFLGQVQVKKQKDVEIQLFDADLIASWEHLFFAVVNSLTAFRNGMNISKSLAMETMLFASGCRQIRKALEFMGVGEKSSKIALLVIGNSSKKVEDTLFIIQRRMKGTRDDRVLDLSSQKMHRIVRAFGISDIQIKTVMKKQDAKAAVIDLVIEKMALLATYR